VLLLSKKKRTPLRKGGWIQHQPTEQTRRMSIISISGYVEWIDIIWLLRKKKKGQRSSAIAKMNSGSTKVNPIRLVRRLKISSLPNFFLPRDSTVPHQYNYPRHLDSSPVEITMGKKKRGHPDVEELLARPWCYYCTYHRPCHAVNC
jgi:hypothetical protein